MTAFFKKWKKYFTFAALLSCFVNILQLTFPFYMFTIYRNVIISYSGFSLANITTAAFFAVMVLGLFSYLRSRLLALAGKDLSLELRQGIYSGMIKGCVLDNKRSYQGGLNDLEVLRNYLSSPSIYALFDAPWAPFYLALIYLFHPVLGIIATCGALVMVGLSALQEILVRKSMKAANIKNAHNYRFVESFMRNAEVINGMGMINAISDRFVQGNNQVLMNQTKSSCHAGTIQALIKPMQNVIQVLIYCAGAYYAMKEGFNVGLMVAASIIMGRGLAPLMQVMSSWRLTTQAKESYQRLKGFSAMLEQQAQTMPLPVPKGHLNVAGAVFRIEDQVLLKGVFFELKPGEFLGVIGPSGAGKTTLCRLLLGIWPSFGGKVYLDGKDIFFWNKEELGQYIGYLPQEIELFPGTVEQNIARLGIVDREQVENTLDICGIKDMVDSFPQGLETQLEGENGLRLSGGQKQKIGLARAMYKNPRFLVLDEPTSNLDEQGEQQLLGALASMKKYNGCTCIMVTHKPSLLHSMDKILVMRDGQVAMFGSKDEVFAKFAGAA
ncbi:type I secretion system permease/ATPase [Desulfobacula toluolica]|uniref:PrtD: proteases secretion ATP-binding protein n=1 Tax=Desulfobacula toluolica (strain DSM 7467 / Tol2) TaxID=651182 RepID=K0NIH2_DESTT|nr:type I secretion system permease/ATPase [Desulfobacula toluolica]CCK79563.1 PrtD: proteases secretion ATP-binding protein [Desulfobacula toluolica Tol2]